MADSSNVPQQEFELLTRYYNYMIRRHPGDIGETTLQVIGDHITLCAIIAKIPLEISLVKKSKSIWNTLAVNIDGSPNNLKLFAVGTSVIKAAPLDRQLPPGKKGPDLRYEFSIEDRKFLKSLRISPDSKPQTKKEDDDFMKPE